jgi:hypothetical protein
MCNFVVVNTMNPTTEVDKWVAGRFKEISNKYGLNKGNKIRFEFPKELIVADKDNPGKKIKPASFLIRFDGIRRTDKGQEHWRYYLYETPRSGGKKEYKPTGKLFDGAWEFGLDDLEFIFFLLEVYPRLINGNNRSTSMSPMIEIRDVEAEIKVRVASKRERASIDAKLYLSEEEGGYSEQQLRDAAARLFIPNSSTDDPDIVRDAIDSKIKTMGDSARNIFVRTVKTVDNDSKQLAQLLLDFGIVKLSPVKGSGEKAWVEVREDGTEVNIVVLAKTTKKGSEIGLLSKFLLGDPKLMGELSERLEAAKEAAVKAKEDEETEDTKE